jgi:membrane-associated phospholipid phosphatase
MLRRLFLLFALAACATSARAHAEEDAVEARVDAEAAADPEASSPEEEALDPAAPTIPSASEASEPVVLAPTLVNTTPWRAKRARRPPLTGEQYRYGNLWLIPRGVLSGIAIPASIGTWDEADVARFASVTLTVTALMLPTGPSADVRIQNWLRGLDTPGLDRMFPKIYTLPMAIGLGVYTTALSAGFFFFNRPKLREYVSLMLEALGITQFYHVALKLMIGREGPYQGSREGHVFGPTKISFPGGTPSGHAASAFAVLVTAAEYYGGWPIRVLCYLASAYLATSFLYNHQHFLSDVIWGAAIGDSVAKWVVRHRASDQRPSREKTKLVFSPMAFEGGGGMRLSLRGGSFL